MESKKKRSATAKPTKLPTRKPHKAPKAPKPKERQKTGRKRRGAESAVARWIDSRPESMDVTAKAIGISTSSLYQIRRGTQGVSLATAQRMIEYSEGALTLEDLTKTP